MKAGVSRACFHAAQGAEKHVFVQWQEPPASPALREAGPGSRVDKPAGVACKVQKGEGQKERKRETLAMGRRPSHLLGCIHGH